MATEKKHYQITVRLNPDFSARIDRCADSMNLNTSAFTRLALTEAVERRERVITGNKIDLETR